MSPQKIASSKLSDCNYYSPTDRWELWLSRCNYFNRFER